LASIAPWIAACRPQIQPRPVPRSCSTRHSPRSPALPARQHATKSAGQEALGTASTVDAGRATVAVVASNQRLDHGAWWCGSLMSPEGRHTGISAPGHRAEPGHLVHRVERGLAAGGVEGAHRHSSCRRVQALAVDFASIKQAGFCRAESPTVASPLVSVDPWRLSRVGGTTTAFGGL